MRPEGVGWVSGWMHAMHVWLYLDTGLLLHPGQVEILGAVIGWVSRGRGRRLCWCILIQFVPIIT